jgi:hypothetical protein
MELPLVLTFRLESGLEPVPAGLDLPVVFACRNAGGFFLVTRNPLVYGRKDWALLSAKFAPDAIDR